MPRRRKKGSPVQIDSAKAFSWLLQHIGSKGTAAGTPLTRERERLVAAQARRAELDNDLREARLLPAEDVQRMLSAAMVIISQHLDALGGRVAGQLAPMDQPGPIRALLFQECRAIRASAADALLKYDEATYRGKRDGKHAS